MKTKNFNNSHEIRHAKAGSAVSGMRRTSLKKRLSKLTTKEIEVEIIAARKAINTKVIKNT